MKRTKKSLSVLAAALLIGSAVGFASCDKLPWNLPWAETHELQKIDAKEATCTEDGNIEYYQCTEEGCGKYYADAEGKKEIKLADTVVEKKGHDVKKQPAVAPTCTEDGLFEYWQCTVCELIFVNENATATIDKSELADPMIGHDWGKWTASTEVGKHIHICSNDETHTEMQDCKYTQKWEFKNEGHYHLCSVCGGESAIEAHDLETKYTAEGHWQECKECGYKSETTAHEYTISIAVNGSFVEDGSVTAADLTLTETCECGHWAVRTEGVTVDENVLVVGENSITVHYGDKTETIVVTATEAPRYTLTVNGSAFADDTSSVALKAGEKVPYLSNNSGKTFAGYIDGALNYYESLENYTMPANDVEFTALYIEDMAHFAPADAPQNGASYAGDARGIHKYYDGIIGTEYTFHSTDERTRPHTGSDTGKLEDGSKAYVNTYAPANGYSFMFICVVNDSDKDYTVLYQAENYGVQSDDLMIVVKAHSTAMMPFHYGNGTNYGSFSTCDHWITLKSELAEGESATLGFYGYIYMGGNNAITSMRATMEKTFYQEGEEIDLSGLEVSVTLGESNYYMPIFSGYTCNVTDGQKWTPDIKSIDISFGGMTSSIKLNSHDDWVAFTLATAQHNSQAWVNAKFVEVEGTNLTATQITVAAGTAAGSDVGFNPTKEGNTPNAKALNVRIPSYGGRTRTLEFHVTNNGTQAISFRIYSENYGDCGGVDVYDLQPGESRVVVGTACPDGVSPYPSSIGNNYNFKLLSDVGEEEAIVTVYGYFKAFANEFRSLSLNGATSQKTTFKVGETFTSRGLTVDTAGDTQSHDVNITNYTTDWDEHVFTAEDVGTQTVTVTWNGLTTTYTITVVAE